MAVCVLSCAGSVLAAGCHVPERPVLAQTLSWDHWQLLKMPHTGLGARPATPAVMPLPCQGEIPTLPSVVSIPMAATFGAAIGPEAPGEGGPAVVESLLIIPSPLSIRLDRPPRPV
jgi:hypothetical protein